MPHAAMATPASFHRADMMRGRRVMEVLNVRGLTTKAVIKDAGARALLAACSCAFITSHAVVYASLFLNAEFTSASHCLM